MLLPNLTTDEIRRRVKEAETLLRVAAQHARDASVDPSKGEHASARIQSICKEVESLFPGMREPQLPDPELQEALARLQVHAGSPSEAQPDDDDAVDGTNDGEDDAVNEDGQEEEWDVDYVKLGAAIENEELMSRFPEPDRSAFKRAARYLIDSNERQELFSRVVAAFETLSTLTEQNAEDIQRKLALAMTLEELASKHKA